MDFVGKATKRTSIEDLPQIRREAPSLADMITRGIDRASTRSDELYRLLNGRATQQQCSAIAELERLGVIEDVRADGTVAAGPNYQSYQNRAA